MVGQGGGAGPGTTIPGYRFAGRLSYLLISLLCLAAYTLLRLSNPLPTEILRDGGIGLIQGFAKQSADGPKLLIVDVDDATIARYRKWPLPRDVLARLIDIVARQKPKAIGLSFVFSEPGTSTRSTTAPGNLTPDEFLANSMRGRPIILGVAASRLPSTAETRFAAKPAIVLDNRAVLESLPRVAGLTPVLDPLTTASAGIGMLSIQLSHGGVPRRLPTLMLYEGTPIPSLPIEMLRVGAGDNEVVVRSDRFGMTSVTTAGQTIATDQNGLVWFPTKFRDRISRVSALDLLDGRRNLADLSDSYVLIGSTASGLASEYISNEGGLLPGLDALSLSLAALLDGTSLAYPVDSVFIEILLAVLFIAIAFMAALRLNASGFLAIGAASVLGLWAGSVWLATDMSRIVDPALISVLLGSAYFCLFLNKFRLNRLASDETIGAREGEIRDLRRRSAQASVMGGNARMSATLSHELRQPLAAVRNYLGAITRLASRATGPAPPPSSGDLIGYAEEAKRQVTSMSDIMREIDDVMQNEVTQSRETDFHHVVTDAVWAAIDANADKAADVHILEDIRGTVPPVIVNTPQIEQVVRNLVTNALEAPRARIPLEIRVSISTGNPDDVEVVIRDNAAGIPEADQEMVFAPYVSSKPGGSGIGLSLCRDIIEAHGGRLWFDSAPDKGTAFHFTVSRAPEE